MELRIVILVTVFVQGLIVSGDNDLTSTDYRWTRHRRYLHHAKHSNRGWRLDDIPPHDGSGVFSSLNGTVELAQIGATVVLDCFLHRPIAEIDGPIMWSKASPFVLLSIGGKIHSPDPRLWTDSPRNKTRSENDQHLVGWNWPLIIRGVQESDAGVYKCQTSSDPPEFILLSLKTIDARAVIPGPPERFIKAGSKLQLDCNFINITHNPDSIFWYRNDRMINYDSDVEVRTTRLSPGGRMRISPKTSLVIHHARPGHSGNYTCSASPLSPTHVVVHVINSEDNKKSPAAVAASSAAASKTFSLGLSGKSSTTRAIMI